MRSRRSLRRSRPSTGRRCGSTAYDGSSYRPGRRRHRRCACATSAGCATCSPRPVTWDWPAPTSAATSSCRGVHPGDPYDALRALRRWRLRRPSPAEGSALVRELGWRNLLPPEPRRRRRCRAGAARSRGCGTPARATRRRSAPLRRVERLLREGARPVDGLHLRGVPQAGREPGGGAGGEVRPRRPQARPEPRACGCSTSAAAGAAWSGTPPRTTASTSSAVTLSRAAGELGAGARSSARGCRGRCRDRTPTTATSPGREYDAICSIGLTEHIGVRNYPAYFALPARQAARRRAAAQPLHHPRRQPDRRIAGRRSSTATSSPTASWPAPGHHHRGMQDTGFEVATRRTCASTTR